MKTKTSRRQFIGVASTLLTGTLIGANKVLAAPNIMRGLGSSKSIINGVKIGVITYSFRDMTDQGAEATLDYVLKSGISAIELMGGPAESYAGAPENTLDFRALFPLWRKRRDGEELTAEEQKTLAEAEEKRKVYQEEVTKWRSSVSMDKFEKLGAMYKKAGVEIYAFKPDAFGMNSSDADIAYGLKAAKALGASHVTTEHPGDDAHTLKLGKAAEKYGMKVAYHGHEQQTPTLWDTALSQSPANMVNVDLGHFVAAGNSDPLGFLRAKHDRIASMHLKDRKSKANGGDNLPWGEGDTPIKQALQLMRDSKYKFPATIEFEYKTPEGSTPVEEVKKCLAYCKGALT